MIASGSGWVGGWGVKEEGCDSKWIWVAGEERKERVIASGSGKGGW